MKVKLLHCDNCGIEVCDDTKLMLMRVTETTADNVFSHVFMEQAWKEAHVCKKCWPVFKPLFDGVK